MISMSLIRKNLIFQQLGEDLSAAPDISSRASPVKDSQPCGEVECIQSMSLKLVGVSIHQPLHADPTSHTPTLLRPPGLD